MRVMTRVMGQQRGHGVAAMLSCIQLVHARLAGAEKHTEEWAAVRALAKWSYRSRFGDSSAEEDEQDLKEILEALASWDLGDVARSVRTVKSRAGAVWEARSDVWQHVERVSAQQGGQVQHSPSSSAGRTTQSTSSAVQTRHSTSSEVQTSNDGCGCLALVGFAGLATAATLLRSVPALAVVN